MKPYKFDYDKVVTLARNNHTDDFMYLLSELNQATTYISNLEYAMVDLERDNKRLEDENRFLLRTIDDMQCDIIR